MSKKRFIIVILMCLLMVGIASADDFLIKINSDDLSKIPDSAREKLVFRFQGGSFLLAQGDKEVISEFPRLYGVLDSIKPDSLYYIVRIGQSGRKQIKSELEKIGDILLEFSDSVLMRIVRQNELILTVLGLQLMFLPESIRLDLKQGVWMSPVIMPEAETAADVAMIKDIIGAVSQDNIGNFIYDLQENKDLDAPHITYKSRFCLRVRETDDPSDEACDNAADYIFNKFKEYGLEVEYDVFPHEVLTQGKYQMRNVVATLPGKGFNSQRVFLITGHYDSIASKSSNWLLDWKKMPAPGADDNASAVAAILEAARILSQYEFESTIRFIAFSGEEFGLHGSIHYAKSAVQRGDELAGVINLDMIAYDPDEPDIDIVTNPGSEWLAGIMLSIQRKYNIEPLNLIKMVKPDMIYSDHAPFWQNGYNAISCIDNSDFDSPEFYPFMHTTQDTIDKLNIEMATTMAKIATATLASLADPVNDLPHPDLSITEADIHLSSENPAHNEPIQLMARIHNIGAVDAKGIKVQVWIDEPLAREPVMVAEEFVDVMAGGYAEIDTSFTLREWGNYTVKVKANPDYRIFEIDGSNNTAVKIISVGSTSLVLGKLIIYPNPVNLSSGDGVNIAYTLSKEAPIQLDIYSISGELVYQKQFISGEQGGRFGSNDGIKWDGTNMVGSKVASGVYLCYISASDGNGNIEAKSKKLVVIR